MFQSFARNVNNHTEIDNIVWWKQMNSSKFNLHVFIKQK